MPDIRIFGRFWTPERACIIRMMLPGVAQARPPRKGGKAVPQGHQMRGILPPTLQPRVTRASGAAVGSVDGLERLDIVRHLVTPAHVKTCRVRFEPFQVQQGRLNLPFPAVQGIPIEDTCPNGQGMF
ncbi:MAG: hypothetical protein BCS36_13120 [Desulfovibrio sp. MES5]|nr:MAG: hypothetical protein BCS36_13120 [Desulfovibrio sp. MES5]